MVKVPYAWLKNANSEDEKKKIVDVLTNNVYFNSLFLKLLSQFYQELEDKEIREEEFCKPEVTHLLAHRAGQKVTLNKIADLFNFKTEGEN